MAKKEEKMNDFSYPTKFIMGGKHYSILTVVTFPRELYPGFLSNINSISGVKLSIKHIPVQLEALRDQVVEEINDLKNAIANDKNTIAQQKYREDVDALTSYYNDLNEFKPRVFNFQMHLIVSGDNDEELYDRLSMVHMKLDGMDMRAIPLMFAQNEVLMSCMPIFPPQDLENRIGNLIPSFNVAGMYPFVFDCLKDNGSGTILGTDSSGGIILFNQFLYLEEQEPNRNNANTMIIGSKQSGKSSVGRLLFRTSVRNGQRCFYIDPNGELSDFIAGIGGSYIQFGKGNNLINPLEVVFDVDDNEISTGLGYTAFTRAISHFRAFMLYFSPGLTADAISILGNVLMETYNRFNINGNTNFNSLTPESYPVLDDLYATVRGKLVSMNDASAERNALDLLEKALRPFTAELREYFNGHTTLELDNDTVAFSFSLIQDENLRNALMFNTLRYCYGKSLTNDRIKSIIVDKLEYLVKNTNPYGLGLIAQIMRKSAKYYTGVTLIYEPDRMLVEQNLINEFKAIFENTSYFFITGFKKSTLDYVAKWISLNETEQENIRYIQTGSALFICGRRRMNISITLTPDELAEFNVS